MRFAKDRAGLRVCADHATRRAEYLCPSCGKFLVLKRGHIQLPHFAHFPNKPCNDTWSYCESPWQQKWQSRFPADSQEVMVSHNAQTHRADIIVGNDVILFQDAAITAKFFREKTKYFQHNEQNHVFWVIHVEEDIAAGILRYNPRDKNSMFWDHPPAFLKKVDLKKDKKLHIILDFGDKDGLKKVEWIAPDSGFGRFIVDRSFSPDLFTEEGRELAVMNKYGRFEAFKQKHAPWHRKMSSVSSAQDPRWHICEKTESYHCDKCKSCEHNLINEFRSANPKAGTLGGLFFYCKYPAVVAEADDQGKVNVDSIWLK